MKKLMIAACAVAFAAVAQAATVSWTITDVYDGNTTDKASGVAYLFTSAVTAPALDQWETAEQAMTWINANALGKDGTAFSWTGSNGTFSMASPGVDVDNLGLTADGSTKYQLWALVFNTDEVKEGSDYFATSMNSKPKAITAGTVETGISIGTQAANSQVAGNWGTIGAVPEPTSGLLLLLGVAGLALRRRRA